jgi:hypothetical protein
VGWLEDWVLSHDNGVAELNISAQLSDTFPLDFVPGTVVKLLGGGNVVGADLTLLNTRPTPAPLGILLDAATVNNASEAAAVRVLMSGVLKPGAKNILKYNFWTDAS